MNKAIVPLYILYLFLLGLIAQSLLLTMNNGEIVLSFYTIQEDTGLIAVWNFLTFLFALFTFGVEDIPAVVNFIIIYLPTIYVLTAYIIPLIRGVS